VASCPAKPSERGYATPAALVVSLAVATMAVTMVDRSVTHLRLARADLQRMEAEYTLDGAHLTAAAQIVRSNAHGPYKWMFGTDAGWVEAQAEAEALKLGPADAAQLSDASFQLFGVQDIAALRGRLLAMTGSNMSIADLDVAPLWRLCAPSAISYYGATQTFTYVHPNPPGPGPDPQSWRIGEVWRIRLTSEAGWSEERSVRFTGDAQHPVAVIDRHLSRNSGSLEPCSSLLDGVFATSGVIAATP